MGEDRLVELYRRYGPYVYARCWRMLSDDAAAEDATQETFMRVQRHLDKAPNLDAALGWIYRIATNYCLNEIRDRRLRPEPSDELPEVIGRSSEELLADRDLVARLVARAPEKLRVVAWLHHVDGMEHHELAALLEITRQTVTNRLDAFATFARKYVRRTSA